MKYPIILPIRDWITKLIVKHYHKRRHHIIGINKTMAQLAQRYWIIRGREEVRECGSQCYGKIDKLIMAPPPSVLFMKLLHVLERFEVDYAGPFMTIQERRRKRSKMYLCLFTCLLSREIHFEIAYGLDTVSFSNTFFQMSSRKGLL